MLRKLKFLSCSRLLILMWSFTLSSSHLPAHFTIFLVITSYFISHTITIFYKTSFNSSYYVVYHYFNLVFVCVNITSTDKNINLIFLVAMSMLFLFSIAKKFTSCLIHGFPILNDYMFCLIVLIEVGGQLKFHFNRQRIQVLKLFDLVIIYFSSD